MDERDMRDMRGMDGRRLPPRNSRGEFMSRGRGRGRRGDRGMDYGYDMRMGDGRVIRSYPTMHPQGDYGDMARGGRRGQGGGRGRDRGDYGDYRGEDMRRGDMRGDYERDMRGDDYGMDGHHYPQGQMGGYQPIEAMGYFSGYYGNPDHGDYRGGRDYGYDMRGGYGRRDYGDYGYYDYGDYGETLSTEELQKWERKLMEQLDEREKQMFKKEAIIPKFKQMGIEMKGFNEEELYVETLAQYTDHKASIGQNPDLAIKLARDFMIDPDSNVKGGERLAVYYDTFVDD